MTKAYSRPVVRLRSPSLEPSRAKRGKAAPTIIAVILLLAFYAGIKPLSAEPEIGLPHTATNSPFKIIINDANGRREILGTDTSDMPQRYAIIKESPSKKKFLYKEGDYINNEFKIAEIYKNFLLLEIPGIENGVALISNMPYMGIEFIKTVELDTFEYSYRLVDDKNGIETSRFELVDIRGHKAILERAYKDQPQGQLEKISRKPPAPAADEIFFTRLKTKKISQYAWEVDSKSVPASAINNIQKAAACAADNIKRVGFGKNGLTVGLSSKTFSGQLDRSGFLVDELSPPVMEKAGFKKGDIIKAVNGKQICNMIDLIFLFLEVRNGSVSQVNVELLRGSNIKTLTYIIK